MAQRPSFEVQIPTLPLRSCGPLCKLYNRIYTAELAVTPASLSCWKTSEFIEVPPQWLAYRDHSIEVGCYVWNSERVGAPPVRQQVTGVQVNSVRPAPAGEPAEAAPVSEELCTGSSIRGSAARPRGGCRLARNWGQQGLSCQQCGGQNRPLG